MSFRSVFDPRFRYRNADSTDVRLTFERIKREYRQAQRRAQHAPANSEPPVETASLQSTHES